MAHAKISTRKKLTELGTYLQKQHKKLRKVDEGNISGFSINKKIIAGKKTVQYAIVYHVIKKRNSKNLKKDKKIPAKIKVKFGNGMTRVLPTDVIETGKFHFHYGLGCAVHLNNSNYGGSLGLFLSDAGNRVYLLTNYHVLAAGLIANGQYSYYNGDLNANDVTIEAGIGRLNASFYRGRISTIIDAALAYIPPNSIPQGQMNTLPFGRIGNYPATNYVNQLVTVYGFKDYNKDASISTDTGVVTDHATGSTLTNLIQMDRRVTTGGDSGALVLLKGASLPVGIVVGADDNFTYAISLNRILAYFATFNLGLKII